MSEDTGKYGLRTGNNLRNDSDIKFESIHEREHMIIERILYTRGGIKLWIIILKWRRNIIHQINRMKRENNLLKK